VFSGAGIPAALTGTEFLLIRIMLWFDFRVSELEFQLSTCAHVQSTYAHPQLYKRHLPNIYIKKYTILNSN